MSERLTIDDGGSAFPGFQYEPGSGCCRTTHGPDGQVYSEVHDTGMSLRDWFAGQAVQGIVQAQFEFGHKTDVTATWVANHAYRFADAMLAARKAVQP